MHVLTEMYCHASCRTCIVWGLAKNNAETVTGVKATTALRNVILAKKPEGSQNLSSTKIG